MGMNRYPGLPDRFEPWLVNANVSVPAVNANDTQMESWQRVQMASNPLLRGKIDAYYALHCYPTAEQVVKRLREVRAEHPELRRVYIMTNGWGGWVVGLREGLEKDGWEEVVVSGDVEVDAEQMYVEMGVDMGVAVGADVFVGNGVTVFFPMFFVFLWLINDFGGSFRALALTL